MDESTFFKQCKNLAGDTSDTSWTADEVAGFFQRFRPDGRRLEALFNGIPAGLEVFSRLSQVFGATATGPKDPRRSDLYFVVHNPIRTTDERLVRYGADQLANWRQMAADVNEQELVELLTPIPRVRISKGRAPEADPNNYDSLDDVQPVWHGELAALCPHARWMREAFYSIACDYQLARYLTWPWYMNSSSINEPFEPYFNLWLHGATLRCEAPDNIILFVPSIDLG
jgi:hypothetical protein